MALFFFQFTFPVPNLDANNIHQVLRGSFRFPPRVTSNNVLLPVSKDQRGTIEMEGWGCRTSGKVRVICYKIWFKVESCVSMSSPGVFGSAPSSLLLSRSWPIGSAGSRTSSIMYYQISVLWALCNCSGDHVHPSPHSPEFPRVFLHISTRLPVVNGRVKTRKQPSTLRYMDDWQAFCNP